MQMSSLRLPGAAALVVLLCLFGTFTPWAFAQQQPAGRVTVTLGHLEAVAADGSVRRLSRGDPVFQGDTLRSGPQGRAQIRFTDRGILSLRPDTALAISDYAYESNDPAAGRQQLNLDRGGFRTQTGRVAQASRQAYRVQTPVAVIGIRGTVFDAHQEVGGGLLVGSSQGGVEVQSNTGIVGRIGAGENFNFLRVNPDGSIDYLLETPDAFSVTPGVEEGEEDEEADALSAADGDASSVESTAGTDPTAGANFVSQTTNPGTTGITSPSETGSGIPPTTEPLAPVGPAPVLSPQQTAALLADNRFGLAVGVQGATVDASGNLQPGPSGLFGGLAAFNSPLLALSSDRSGLGTGIAGSNRQAILDEADIFLLPGSGEFTLQVDKGGVPGLVWGRYAAPVSVFVDPLDNTRILELDRDLLFVLGRPTDIADLQGIFFYELTAWDAISSGLPISMVLASGSLDLGTGVYAGFIDILFGADSASGLSLFAEFQSQVNGGVLEGIQFGVFDLFEFATETTVDAEGSLAGFFTGDAASFLQLAFDFRVPSRSDADVRGLALLQRQTDLPDGALTPAEVDLLNGGKVFVAALCCFDDFQGGPTGALGGFATNPVASGGADTLLGFNLVGPFEAADPLDPEFVFFPPDVVIRRGTSTVASTRDFGSDLFGFEWQGQTGPVRAHDAVTGEVLATFGQSLQILTGIPTPTANLIGSARFELLDFSGFVLINGASGFEPGPLLDVEFSFNVNFSTGALTDGVFFAPIDIDGGLGAAESGFATLFALFDGQVAFSNQNPFVAFDIFAGGMDVFGAFDELNFDESDLAGFFANTGGNRFAAAFRFQTVGNNFLDDGLTPILAIGTAVLGRQDLALTAAEAALFGNGLGFVGADCCFAPGAAAGFATAAGLDAVLGVYVDANGDDISPTDPLFGVGTPNEIIRRAGSFAEFEVQNLFFSAVSDAVITEVDWFGGFSPALNLDAATGSIIGRLDELVLFQTAMPSSVATLQAEGFTTFAGSTGAFTFDQSATQFGFESNAGASFLGFNASFNVDLASGDIFAGHLFLVDERAFLPFGFGEILQELGFEVFFSGRVGVDNGNSFAALDILDGVYHGWVPLDLEESSLNGFFAGENGIVFLGGYALATKEGFGPLRTASGIFGLSNQLDEEFRLNLDEAAGWFRLDAGGAKRPSLGMAVFASDSSGAVPSGGVLLGRSNDPNGAENFVMGANPLRRTDLLTGGFMRTDRADFFAQPFEFLLRRENAFDFDFNPDVTPSGMPSDFAEFRVSWGAWRDDDGSAARIFINSDSAVINPEVSDVFFVNVNPTPISGLADLTGSFAYAGGPGFGPIAHIGAGGGSVLGGVQYSLDSLEVAFDLNFGTGAITDGFLFATYGAEFSTQIEWDVEFNGFLNGAITDFTVNSILVTEFGSGIGIVNSGHGAMTGLVTGPMAERHVGGFSFAVDFDSLGTERLQGLWVIDRGALALPPGNGQ
ncbi:MAG: FecR domain-containing protein [Gammaproteobacteria bacterium]|nr:FecR domain-containing protein [Gammaproteobacteria bacterium]